MQKMLILLFIVISSCGGGQTTSNKLPGEGNNTQVSMEQVRQNYVETYNKPTTFFGLDEGRKGEEIKISGKYYCTFDNGRTIPGKLIPETRQEFKTHNFAADIVIISNKDTIIKKTISARDFADDIPADLSQYGVLSEPVFLGYDEKNDEFDFHFGISIPLTNTAVSRVVRIKRNDDLEIRD